MTPATTRRAVRRGASALEFGLSLPVLLTVVFALVDGGWWLHGWMGVTLAAADGARLGSGVRVAAGPEQVAEDAARARLTRLGLSAPGDDVTARRLTTATGPALEVTVTVPFVPLVGLGPWPNTLTGRAVVDWYGDVGEGR